MSCENVYNKFAVSHNCPGYYWIANSVFCGMSFTGSSCEHIFKKYSEIYRSDPKEKLGYYHLNNNNWTYCNMTEIAANASFTTSTCTAVEIIRSAYRSFLPDESCESIYNNNEDSHDWSGHYWVTKRVYCGMNYTGQSCEDIYYYNPETRTKSGYYRVNNQWMYCNMAMAAIAVAINFIPTCAGVGGGWRRIANIDIKAGDDCPSGWTKAGDFVTFCRKSFDGPGCSSTTFTTNGITYQKVCGKARGYQKGHPNGGSAFNSVKIDDHYVNGLSITYGSPRQHIWTYANGDFDNRQIRCPCDKTGGTTPSFVGNNYYCESGRGGTDDHDAYHFSDPLWDGSGCIYSNCCSVPNHATMVLSSVE